MILCCSNPCLNSGKAKEASGQLDEAIQFYRYTLDTHQILSKRVRTEVLLRMSALYRRRGEDAVANQIMTSMTEPRDVFVVLDVSGSMAGSRIRTCRDSIVHILDNVLHPQDSISLTVFSSRVRIVLPLDKVGDRAAARSAIMNQTNVSGGTAFWDALHTTFQEIILHPQFRQTWVVALTDGEDNSSKKAARDLVRSAASLGDKCTLVLISVGQLSNAAQIESIATAAKGHLLSADGGSAGIASAFEQVGKLLVAQLNVESL